MTKFGKNIKKIRGVKNLSQSAFAEIFDIKRANIGAYEEGRAEPKIDLILEIAKYFSIPLEDILQKELTINDIYDFKLFSEKPQIEDLKVLHNKKEKPVLVRSVDYQYYVKHFGNSGYLKNLRISDEFGLFNCSRVFELTKSVKVSEVLLGKGDYFLCEPVNNDSDDMVKVGVLKNSLLFFKGEIKDEKLHYLDLEDSNRKTCEISLVQEMWVVVGFLSKSAPCRISNTDLIQRVTLLEQSMSEVIKSLNISH